jgi:hypothetical protein
MARYRGWSGMVGDAERAGALSPFDWMAAALPLGALLVLGSQIIGQFAFSGAAIRDRIFFVAESGAGTFTALLALAAVALSIAATQIGGGRWTRWSVGAATVVAVIVIVAAVYSVWYLVSLHVHIPGPNSNEGVAISFAQRDWSQRIAEMLHAATAALLAVVTLISARSARSSASPTRITTAPEPAP